MKRGFLLRMTLSCCAAALLVLPALSDDDRQPNRRRMPPPSKIKAGEFPPDFDLPFLELKEGTDGKSMGIVSENETFKLSSFRGKRPVCMIMSSYT